MKSLFHDRFRMRYIIFLSVVENEKHLEVMWPLFPHPFKEINSFWTSR